MLNLHLSGLENVKHCNLLTVTIGRCLSVQCVNWPFKVYIVSDHGNRIYH